MTYTPGESNPIRYGNYNGVQKLDLFDNYDFEDNG